MNTLQKQHMIIRMRSGAEKWIDQEKAERLQEALPKITEHKFISVDGETLNTADLEGVYRPDTLENMQRRKNGQWQCKGGKWHERDDRECNCATLEEKQRVETRNEAVERCGKCKNGWIETLNGMRQCECIKNL